MGESLSQRLTQLFRLADDSCVQLDGDDMFGGTGFLSIRRRAKIRLQLASGEDGEAIEKELSVFVKLSSSSREELGPYAGHSVSYCQHECAFYSCLAAVLRRSAEQCGLSLPLPATYRETMDADGSLLVMEDLDCCGYELATAPMPIEQMRCVLRSLATLQAAYCLCRHRLGASDMADRLIGSRSPFADEDFMSEVPFDSLLHACRRSCLRKLSRFVSQERADVLRSLLSGDNFACRAVARLRLSRIQPGAVDAGVVHGDLWYNNCLLLGGDEQCRIVDWQFGSVGKLGSDLGTLWLSSADNSYAADEFLSGVDYFYETLRSTFEAHAAGAQLPIGADVVRDTAVRSLPTGLTWLLLSADVMWHTPVAIGNALANAADLLRRFPPDD